VRVSFEYVPATETISLISGQQGDTFAPYQTKYNQIELVEKGVVSADAMLKSANNINTESIWVFRLLGFFMMLIGLILITNLLASAADSSSFIDNIFVLSIGFISFCLSFALTMITIAVAWIYHVPIIGVTLLIAGIAVLTLLLLVNYLGKLAQNKKDRMQYPDFESQTYKPNNRKPTKRPAKNNRNSH
ncbi:MAG: hypothetical protein IJF84_09650, partial [Thermoguttaceae bacterium]|nr:hypothetical protein [Thermoguttaceae bacterium]